MSPQDTALMIAGFVAGLLGVPIINWLKSKFNVDDTSALALAVGVSVILAFGSMFAGGALGAGSFSWEKLPALITEVFAIATIVFRVLQGRKA